MEFFKTKRGLLKILGMPTPALDKCCYKEQLLSVFVFLFLASTKGLGHCQPRCKQKRENYLKKKKRSKKVPHVVSRRKGANRAPSLPALGHGQPRTFCGWMKERFQTAGTSLCTQRIVENRFFSLLA